MAITRITSPAITGLTIPNTSINNASLDSVTVLPSGIDTGKVGQVVSVATTTQRSTTSSSFVAVADMSLAITPTATSSKIYLTAMQTMGVPPSGGYWSRVSIFRNGSNLNGNTNGMGSMRTNTGDSIITIPMIYLDSPNSTSAQTYQIYFRSPDSTTIYYNYDSGTTASLVAMEILA
mgnify:FL=1